MSFWVRSLILSGVILGVLVSTFGFAILHREDDSSRVTFSLTNQYGKKITENDLRGRYLLIYFGFTGCGDTCPVQLSKLTQAVAQLRSAGYAQRVMPVFISVDPERDQPQKIAGYLRYFDHRFIGLTGSRQELQRAADSFKTILPNPPSSAQVDYPLVHSSLIYVVDPYSRIIDHISLIEGASVITVRVKKLFQPRKSL
jgi:protein SCO1/2